MTVFWCDAAWLGGPTLTNDVRIDVDQGFMTFVAPASVRPADAIHLDGVTLPGFANTHSHAFHRELRGKTQAMAGTFWTWREEMYQVAGALTPDTYHRLALSVFGEMLASGYTLVGEFHYLHHDHNGTRYTDPNAMTHALVAAADEVGIRLTLLDTIYLHSGLEGSKYMAPEPIQRRFSDGSAEDWVARVGSAEIGEARLGAAIHSVRAVDPVAIRTVSDWARGRRAPLHAHVSEQPAENQACLDAHGWTPVQLLADCGVLDERFTAVHATHLIDEDIRLMGEAGATTCLCPTTERDLADGIGPGAALAKAGSRLAIGSDSQAVIDPLEETRLIELHERLASGRRGVHTVPDLLEAGTVNGYRSLGWPEGGSIRPGALADLVTFAVDEDMGVEDGLARLVFGADRHDVDKVIVGGEVLH